MTVEAKREENELIFKVAGRVDSSTALLLEKEIKDRLETDVTEISMDFSMLDYISSAGLRVLLTTQKIMNKRNGKLIIRNAAGSVQDIFKITGFSTILTIV